MGSAASFLLEKQSDGLVRALLRQQSELSSETFNVTVVIVGGGYAGVTCAALLDSKVNVILIEYREVFVHHLAGLRAMCQGKVWVDRMLIPYDKLLKRGKFIVGDVVEITFDQTVVLSSGEHIPFDHLVLATGVSQGLLGRSGRCQTKDEISRYYIGSHETLDESNKILIIGGGPVGVEMASEIKAVYPKKEVSIIHTGTNLLSSNRPTPPASFYQAVREKLERRGVRIITNDTVVLNWGGGSVIPGQRTVTTMGGKRVEVDLILKAVGLEHERTKLRDFLKQRSDSVGSVKVNRLLQVPSLLNTWCIGDCASTGEMRTTAVAIAHAKIVAKNIMNYVKGRPLVEHKPCAFGSMDLPLGADDGVGYVGDRVRPTSIVVTTKSRELSTEDWTQTLGQSGAHNKHVAHAAS